MSEKTTSRIISPRQRRAFETRARMLDAVEEIVAEQGWEAVTTTRVAATADMAVGTVYRYFTDRNAMLLAAYDSTLDRLVETCHAALENLPANARPDAAAGHLLDVYLDAAAAVPAHAGLLKAMRHLRPLEEEQSSEPGRIASELVAPFFARFAPAANIDALHLHLIGSVLATLVDLYLVTSDERERAFLRTELEAHLLFMLDRIG